MLWNELRAIRPWLPESSDGWHQHVYGGGWVKDTATVSEDAFVGGCAAICGGSFFGGMFHGGRLFGGTFHGGEFFDGVFYGGNFHGGEYYGGSFFGGEFRGGVFYDGTFCGGEFRNGEFRGGNYHSGIFTRTPLLLYGSRFWIGYAGNGQIASGCITRPATWWLDNVERCAKEYDYTVAEQREYRLHVEHIVAWMKLHNIDGYGEQAGTEDQT